MSTNNVLAVVAASIMLGVADATTPEERKDRTREVLDYAAMHTEVLTPLETSDRAKYDTNHNNVSGFSMSDATVKKVRPLSNMLAESFKGKNYVRRAGESYADWNVRIATQREKVAKRNRERRETLKQKVALEAYSKLSESAQSRAAMATMGKHRTTIVDPIAYAANRAGIGVLDLPTVLADDTERAHLALITSTPIDKQGSNAIREIQASIIDAPTPHGGTPNVRANHERTLLARGKQATEYRKLHHGEVSRESDGKVLESSNAPYPVLAYPKLHPVYKPKRTQRFRNAYYAVAIDRTECNHAGSYPSPSCFAPSNTSAAEFIYLTPAQYGVLDNVVGNPVLLGDSARFAVTRNKDGEITKHLAMQVTEYPSQDKRDYVGAPFHGDSWVSGLDARLAAGKNGLTGKFDAATVVKTVTPYRWDTDRGRWVVTHNVVEYGKGHNDKPPVTAGYLKALERMNPVSKGYTPYNPLLGVHGTAKRIDASVLAAGDRTSDTLPRGIVTHGYIRANVAPNLPR